METFQHKWHIWHLKSNLLIKSKKKKKCVLEVLEKVEIQSSFDVQIVYTTSLYWLPSTVAFSINQMSKKT